MRIGEYVAAERNDLTLTVQERGRVEALVRELKELLSEAGTYDLLLAQQLEPRIREYATEALDADENLSRRARYLFGSTEDAADRLTQSSKLILTAGWLQAQVKQGTRRSDTVPGGRVGRLRDQPPPDRRAG